MKSILEKLITVTNKELDSIVFPYIEKYTKHSLELEFISLPSGNFHSRLLAYISTLFTNTILFDIGTNSGRSALSLAHNTTNKIKSYDVVQILDIMYHQDNVEYILGDSTKDKDILNSPFIFLDVNHDGIYEYVLYSFLKDINWKGILMLDDIHLNEPMREFWNSIGKEKYDLTSVGHWSGTGIVIFE